jgi:hypothetical protein
MEPLEPPFVTVANTSRDLRRAGYRSHFGPRRRKAFSPDFKVESGLKADRMPPGWMRLRSPFSSVDHVHVHGPHYRYYSPLPRLSQQSTPYALESDPQRQYWNGSRATSSGVEAALGGAGSGARHFPFFISILLSHSRTNPNAKQSPAMCAVRPLQRDPFTSGSRWRGGPVASFDELSRGGALICEGRTSSSPFQDEGCGRQYAGGEVDFFIFYIFLFNPKKFFRRDVISIINF